MQIIKTGQIINNFNSLEMNDCYKFEASIKKQIQDTYRYEFKKLKRRNVFDNDIYKDVVSKYTKSRFNSAYSFDQLFKDFFIKNQSKEYYSKELLLAKLEEYIFQEIKIEKLVSDAINIKLKLPTIKK